MTNSRSKGTADNAAQILEALSEAADALSLAQSELREALSLIQSGEREPELKIGRIEDIQGALGLVTSALLQERGAWSGYSASRELTNAQKKR